MRLLLGNLEALVGVSSSGILFGCFWGIISLIDGGGSDRWSLSMVLHGWKCRVMDNDSTKTSMVLILVMGFRDGSELLLTSTVDNLSSSVECPIFKLS